MVRLAEAVQGLVVERLTMVTWPFLPSKDLRQLDQTTGLTVGAVEGVVVTLVEEVGAAWARFFHLKVVVE